MTLWEVFVIKKLNIWSTLVKKETAVSCLAFLLWGGRRVGRNQCTSGSRPAVAAALRTYRPGSILARGGAGPGDNVRASPQAWLNLTDHCYRASLAAGNAGAAPGLIQKIGEATAEEVAATGIDWTFAPTVAIARDVRWGRSYETSSVSPELVAECMARATRLRSKPAP